MAHKDFFLVEIDSEHGIDAETLQSNIYYRFPTSIEFVKVEAAAELVRLRKIENAAEKMAERLKANKEASDNRNLYDGYFTAHFTLLFNDKDAAALAEYEAACTPK